MGPDPDSLARGNATFQDLNPKAHAAMTEALSEVSPDLMAYAAAFPFGALYDRGGLSKRDRQLVTVTALATRGDATAQLRVHIDIALNMGITAEELAELFLHLSAYGGFPTAINATMVLRDALANRND